MPLASFLEITEPAYRTHYSVDLIILMGFFPNNISQYSLYEIQHKISFQN